MKLYHFPMITACTVLQTVIVVKANRHRQRPGVAKFRRLVALKLLKGFRWYLKYDVVGMTTHAKYQNIWHCINVGDLGEHDFCVLSHFLLAGLSAWQTPAFTLLRRRFWDFSPCKDDSTNVEYGEDDSSPTFTFIGADVGTWDPKTVNFTRFWNINAP